MRLRVILLFCIVFSASHAQPVNIRISSPATIDPEEVSIAVNPKDPRQLAAGANLNYYYYSTDSGYTWTEKKLSSPYGVEGDPFLIFDEDGNAFYGHLAATPSPGYLLDRVVIHRSADGGKSWDSVSYVGHNPPKQQDKEWIAIDQSVSSPFHKRMYITWMEFDKYMSKSLSDSSRILFAYSDDQGKTWSKGVKVNDINGDAKDDDSTVECPYPAVGPDGEIYVSWTDIKGVHVDKSVDGGKSWGKDMFIDKQTGGATFPIAGINRYYAMTAMACDNSNSAYRGQAYVVWSDLRNGSDNCDILISRTSDGGKTWSPATRVNDDAGRAQQFFPAFTIDQSTGYLYVVFYDRRGLTGNATNVYLAVSRDGGQHFVNYKISSSTFSSSSLVFFGDYIGITALNGHVWPIWTRMDQSKLSVWTAMVSENTLASAPMPNSFFAGIKPNYPNPFRNSTELSFSLQQGSEVRLDIYDEAGRRVKTLAEGYYPAGVYYLNWDGKDSSEKVLPAGVFIYELTTRFGKYNGRMVKE